MQLNKFILPFSLIGLLISPTALAEGSLALDEIMPLINQSRELKQEVNSMLQQTGKNSGDIVCIGIRLGRHFEPLGAARVAPFECAFGEHKILKIEAENLVKLPNGRTLALEQFLEIQPKPETASLIFRLESWKWKNQ